MSDVAASTPETVRAVIAAHVLGDDAAPAALGDVRLHPHQVEGVRRITTLLKSDGGALLADAVGLGKTYVALAVAAGARAPLVIAPAAVRDAWTASARAAKIQLRFASTESLSRHELGGEHDMVIVDEAHHFRNRRTRRFAVATRLCARANVLLLSATPVQNRVADLRALLSLFLGARAEAASECELARYIVRRDEVSGRGAALPRVREARWLGPVDDVDCLQRIVALPPPVPPADGGDAGALLTYTLVRQWSSSRAALQGALTRRLAQARAFEDALRAGRLPTRADMSAWCFADGAQQLAFPELLISDGPAVGGALLPAVSRHADAVADLLRALASFADPDSERAALLERLARDHAGERIVVFAEFADSIARMYALLAPRVRVAMLTHRGGRVAGGGVSRREILARFAPGTAGAAAERIDMLLTTDLLSEGVNLQSASVVVHFDLSWNPARLEQRVGRLRRLGAARDVISVYAVAPPAPSEQLLRLERRLQQKLSVAGRTVGVAGTILPGFVVDLPSPTRARERMMAVLRRWRRADRPEPGCPAAACRATVERPLALVCVRRDDVIELLIADGDTISDAPERIAAVLESRMGADVALDLGRAHRVAATARAWIDRRSIVDAIAPSASRLATVRRAMLHRVETIARRTPRHFQPRFAPLMRTARMAAMATLSAGAERVLADLAAAAMPDAAWLQAVSQFASLNARGGTAGASILAILLLEPGNGG